MFATVPLAASTGNLVVMIAAAAAVVLIIGAVILFRAMWKVPEPNQALLVSGRHHKSEMGGADFGFRIVVGHAVLVIPGRG